MTVWDFRQIVESVVPLWVVIAIAMIAIAVIVWLRRSS